MTHVVFCTFLRTTGQSCLMLLYVGLSKVAQCALCFSSSKLLMVSVLLSNQSLWFLLLWQMDWAAASQSTEMIQVHCCSMVFSGFRQGSNSLSFSAKRRWNWLLVPLLTFVNILDVPIPLFRARVHPKGLILGLLFKDHVSYSKVMLRAKSKQPQAICIHPAKTMPTQYSTPYPAVLSHPSIEVTKQEDLARGMRRIIGLLLMPTSVSVRLSTWEGNLSRRNCNPSLPL